MYSILHLNYAKPNLHRKLSFPLGLILISEKFSKLKMHYEAMVETVNLTSFWGGGVDRG